MVSCTSKKRADARIVRAKTYILEASKPFLKVSNNLVGQAGLEPATNCLRGNCSTS